MNNAPPSAAGGTAWITLAEALMLPTGFLTVAFLTRQLGPEGYGLFTLASTLITWIEWNTNAIFARTTVKFVSEAHGSSADDWRSTAGAIMGMQLGTSVAIAAAVFLLAPAIAWLLQEPALTPLLWLFAIEIPLFNLAQHHQNVLVGIGAFGPRAIASAVRWTARLLFIVVLVNIGLSMTGAALGSIAAVAMDLIVGRCYVRPRLGATAGITGQQLVSYGTPIFLSNLCFRLYEKIDLFALKALGGTTEQVGIYAVAQNLAMLGAITTQALVPITIATLGRLVSQNDRPGVRRASASSLRAVILQLPFIGLAAAAAEDIVVALFGQPFAAAGPLLAALIFGALASVMTAVTSGILVAASKPRWTVALTAPTLAIALVSHWLLIPRYGAMGAAITTAGTATVGAIASVIAVQRLWQLALPWATLGRSLAIGALAIGLSATWPAAGLLELLLKLPTIGLLIAVGFWLSGEISSQEISLLRSTLLTRGKS